MARNPKGFGGAWRLRSGCPGGVGLDDRTATLAGSRRGPKKGIQVFSEDLLIGFQSR
ncbi:hypothetical protein CIAM_46330 (plasmid) [Citrobacter amalonaticus]|nr:hypothetical protein CIAM_46330 [Citrobacter amalonaticus]